MILDILKQGKHAKHVTRIDSEFSVAVQRQLRDPVSGLHAGKWENLTKMDYFYLLRPWGIEHGHES
jgi:hypothetical protein